MERRNPKNGSCGVRKEKEGRERRVKNMGELRNRGRRTNGGGRRNEPILRINTISNRTVELNQSLIDYI